MFTHFVSAVQAAPSKADRLRHIALRYSHSDELRRAIDEVADAARSGPLLEALEAAERTEAMRTAMAIVRADVRGGEP